MDREYDVIVVQWHGDLEHSKKGQTLLPKITETLKRSIEQGATIVHLFERIPKVTADIIKSYLDETSPAVLYLRNESRTICSSGLKSDGLIFNANDDSNQLLLDFVGVLNKEEEGKQGVTEHATLKRIDDDVQVQVISNGHSVLLSKQVGNSQLLALAFGFCGGWNRSIRGVEEFQTLIENIRQTKEEKEYIPLDPLSDMNIIDDFSANPINETEKDQLIKARIGQTTFRRRLLEQGIKCQVCNVLDERFLIASHIKPWCDANHAERLDPENGLLFCPNHDALFDKGYISFNNSGTIIISACLNDQTKRFLNIHEDMKIPMTEGQQIYMKWHREHTFNKAMNDSYVI